MNKFPLIFIFTLFWTFATAQPGFIADEKFDDKVNSLLEFSVPIISVSDLSSILDEVVLLDAREKREYEVSHIPGALFLGYKEADYKILEDLDKENDAIVVYCSVGYRSEKMGDKLLQMGYKNVYNLYGSIFEWANRGQTLVDIKGKKTLNLHTFNKKWSQWIRNPQLVITW